MKKILTSIIIISAIFSPVSLVQANPFPLPPNPVPKLPCSPANKNQLSQWMNGEIFQLSSSGIPMSKVMQNPTYVNLKNQFNACEYK